MPYYGCIHINIYIYSVYSTVLCTVQQSIRSQGIGPNNPIHHYCAPINHKALSYNQSITKARPRKPPVALHRPAFYPALPPIHFFLCRTKASGKVMVMMRGYIPLFPISNLESFFASRVDGLFLFLFVSFPPIRV